MAQGALTLLGTNRGFSHVESLSKVMPAISLDSDYAPELVEFWGQKYKELKVEFDKLKELNARADRTRCDEESARLHDLINTLQAESASRKDADAELRRVLKRTMNEEDNLRKKLAVAEKEIQELKGKLTKAELEQASLSKQAAQIYSQVMALASETDRNRMDAISKMYPPVSFVDPSFELIPLRVTDPRVITASLTQEVAKGARLLFLPRPPNCMPLRVPSPGQSGYWFLPHHLFPEEVEFELIVESMPDEWSYVGCYTTAPLEGHPMQLSEWMCLDEQTKLAHCIRVASQGLPPDQRASYPAQLEVKRKHEMGEWSVPCFSLRCVGFNMALYTDALRGIAARAHPPSGQNGLNIQPSTANRQESIADSAMVKCEQQSYLPSPDSSVSERLAQRNIP